MHTKSRFTFEAKTDISWGWVKEISTPNGLQVGPMYSLEYGYNKGQSPMSNGLKAKEGGCCIMPQTKHKKGGRYLDFQWITWPKPLQYLSIYNNNPISKYDIGPKVKNPTSKSKALLCLRLNNVILCLFCTHTHTHTIGLALGVMWLGSISKLVEGDISSQLIDYEQFKRSCLPINQWEAWILALWHTKNQSWLLV
jgi:hypothetical protein